MDPIDIKRFGLACGVTAAALYLGCVIVMSLASRDGVIFFYNSLLHGLNVSSILRLEMPFYEMVIGIIQTFILAWLSGATIASVYNLGTGKKEKNV